MVFKGQFNAEVMAEYKEWHSWIKDVFLPLVDSEHGDFRHLPFPGGIMDQPYCTMQILNLIQLNYRIVVDEKNREAMRNNGNR